jgi:choline dehydrogenase-like flavoprotein
MPTDALPLRAPDGHAWDVVVIGTGMGGATLGYALARAGLRILFLEKGRSHLRDTGALRGEYAEMLAPRVKASGPGDDLLMRAGRWAEELEDVTGPKPRRFVPFIGSGTGGSSALYGAVLERFFPADFTPRRHHANAGSTLPERWPITYDELRPYYETAERLFQVHGERDPLRHGEPRPYRRPPPVSDVNRELMTFLAAKGLHPYRLPLARDPAAGCPGCQGRLCAHGCKRDAASVCLVPALERHGAALAEQCTVLRLEATRRRVTGVICQWRGRLRTVRAGLVVLAAGALATPALLLGSASARWPAGLANDSGLVGRNLMRHLVDLYAVRPHTGGPFGDTKEIAFNDLYLSEGLKGGTVQSFGAMPPAAMLVAGLEKELRERFGVWAGALFRPVRPLARWLLGRDFTRRVVLASILEDLPYLDNRVSLQPPHGDGSPRWAVQYRMPPHTADRLVAFRRRMAELLAPYPYRLLRLTESNEHLAHACGTCRFGDDPAQSVLDRDNKTHALENLYIVDASFFPSSGGTNPALTIAANALRVAEQLVGRRGSDSCLEAVGSVNCSFSEKL